jgi:hypothetical protein
VKRLILTLSLLLALPAPAFAQDEAATADDLHVDERLRFIAARLKAEAVQARTWEAGWSIVYVGGLGYGSYQLAHARTKAADTEAAVGIGKSLIGGVTMGLFPLKASRGAHELDRATEADGSLARLDLAETLLRRNADEANLRYAWQPHVFSLLMNLVGGAAIWIAGDWKRAAQSTGIAVAVGELQIWTQPWQAKSDLREYRRRFGALGAAAQPARQLAATTPAVHVSATSLAVTF